MATSLVDIACQFVFQFDDQRDILGNCIQINHHSIVGLISRINSE